jgi:uncharacterized iron-regulated membrane protein
LFCGIVLFVVAICFWFRARNHGLWRRILYKTHLWLGIASGIVLFIVCLTGTLIVFNDMITVFFEFDKYFVSHTDKLPLPIEDLIAKVEQNMNGNVYLVCQHNNIKDTAYVMYVKTENNNKDTGVKIRNDHIIVDPYTGESLAKCRELLGREFFNIVLKSHSSLMLPMPFGRIIVGSATLIFVVLALSGFCLWLPANFRNKKSWLNGFIVRFRNKKHTIIYDFHKTLGFFVLIPMLVMALTGLMWSFNWFHEGVEKILNVQHSNIQLKSLPPSPDAKPLPLAYFIKKADELMENKDSCTTSMHEQKDATVFAMGTNHEAFKLPKIESINFDKYTGEVLKHERSENQHLGERIVGLTGWLHVGYFLGLPTQIIYFIACLFATTLPITGVMIWWRKLWNLRKAKNQKITENQQKSA